MPKNSPSRAAKVGQYLTNLLLSAPLFAVLALPYAWRSPVMGWIVARLIAPLAGYSRRIRQNLDLAWPELDPATFQAMVHGVPDNFGRTLVEIYSGPRFKQHLRDNKTQLEGPGLPALQEAVAANRPVILVSGHFGNHDSVRATVSDQFKPVGALYRPLDNIYFNRHWEKAIASVASPVFPRGRRGLAEMVKFLRKGNIIALLIDQHVSDGAELRFFGQPARTSLAAAELALKYDALLLPVFGLRQPDGCHFRPIVDTPIPASSAEEMTQAFNDRLEAMTRAHPDQWFWVHRRWKPGR